MADKVEEQAEEIRALTARYGLEINALATYLDCSTDPAKIESCMIAAKKMGCSRIRVNALRYDKEKGYTQQQLAELTSYSKNHIQQVETAKTLPSVIALLDIAEALEIPPGKLFEFR